MSPANPSAFTNDIFSLGTGITEGRATSPMTVTSKFRWRMVTIGSINNFLSVIIATI